MFVGNPQATATPALPPPRSGNKFINIAPAPPGFPPRSAMPWIILPQPAARKSADRSPTMHPAAPTKRRPANSASDFDETDEDDDFEESYEAKRARNNESVRRCRRKKKTELVEQNKRLVCIEHGAFCNLVLSRQTSLNGSVQNVCNPFNNCL